MLDKILKVLIVLFMLACFLFFLSWYFLACSTSKPERVYYPIMEDAFAIVDLIDVDAGKVSYDCPDEVEEYKPIALINPDAGLPSGYLINECQFARENISGVSRLKKLNSQTKTLKEVVKKQQAVVSETEKAYQDRIFDLEEKSKRSWWEQNDVYLGIAFGLIIGIGVSVAAYYAIDAVENVDDPAMRLENQ